MGKRIIITGASSGIGKSIAEKFANEWKDVELWLLARRVERLEVLKSILDKSLYIPIKVSKVDVTNNEEVEQFQKIVEHEWGSVDILVNNAGLALGLNPIHQGDLSDWETMIDTNIKGLLYMTKAIAPILVQQKSGHIINMGSTAGKVVYENGNVYSATKYAVDGLSQSMRVDLLSHNIKVTSVNPGMVETEFSEVRFKGDKEKAQNAYKGIEVLTPNDIADVVFYSASLPPHVCINDVTVTCTQQANSTYKFVK